MCVQGRQYCSRLGQADSGSSPLLPVTSRMNHRPSTISCWELHPPTAQRDTPDVALESFQKIVTDEESRNEQGEFGFKALKQMTKLTFKLGRYDDALRHYKTLLTYTKKAVTRNVAEKAINRVLDYVSAEEGVGLDRMQEFYEVTMKALEEQKNEVSVALAVLQEFCGEMQH